MARNQKVNTSSESTETRAKKGKIAKERTKKSENHDIEKARRERTGEEVRTRKATRKRSIVANTVERKAKRLSKLEWHMKSFDREACVTSKFSITLLAAFLSMSLRMWSEKLLQAKGERFGRGKWKSGVRVIAVYVSCEDSPILSGW